jgi:hypothetical protein
MVPQSRGSVLNFDAVAGAEFWAWHGDRSCCWHAQGDKPSRISLGCVRSMTPCSALWASPGQSLKRLVGALLVRRAMRGEVKR